MARLDAYLRSVEKFGAAGAVLTSNQAVTLKFPTGDRHATQVTPHDTLVAIVREIAPPAALDLIDTNRPARFEYESNGAIYAIGVGPKPGKWQVVIEPAATAPARPTPAPKNIPRPTVSPVAVAAASDMMIERGQYDATRSADRVAASGSTLLDQLTHAARSARASDLYLAADIQPMQRVEGQLTNVAAPAISADQLSRELGLVSPTEARAAWTELGSAVFAYGDGIGRVRATLGRDQRGPCAALRLLPDEPPAFDRLGLRMEDWLERTGLVVIAGAAGTGKTVVLGSIVRALAERKRRVVVIEQPIELLHASSWISQREIGAHVASVAAGVTSAVQEGSDAIALGVPPLADGAAALVDALAAGLLVVTVLPVPATGTANAIERLLDRVPTDRRDGARSIVAGSLLGIIGARGRGFEVLRPDPAGGSPRVRVG